MCKHSSKGKTKKYYFIIIVLALQRVLVTSFLGIINNNFAIIWKKRTLLWIAIKKYRHGEYPWSNQFKKILLWSKTALNLVPPAAKINIFFLFNNFSIRLSGDLKKNRYKHVPFTSTEKNFITNDILKYHEIYLFRL